MANEVELGSLDLRYESFRLKAPAVEQRLLGSIAQRGIQEPLAGVEVQGRGVLLNGFKRYRCARKLRLATVPYMTGASGKLGHVKRYLVAQRGLPLELIGSLSFMSHVTIRPAHAPGVEPSPGAEEMAV